MRRLARLLSLLAPRALLRLVLTGLALAGSAGFAAAVDPAFIVQIDQAQEKGGVDAAIAFLQAAIAAEPDAESRADLLAELAERLRAAGRPAQAGAVEIRLADEIAASSGVLSPDLLSPLGRAADDFTAAKADRDNVAALARMLPVLRAAAEPDAEAALVERLEAFARSGGDALAVSAAASALAANEAAEAAEADEASRAFPADPDAGFHTVRIYYATDRAETGSKRPEKFYGAGRGSLQYGTALVSIPARHRPGQVEKPSIWSLEFRPDPERHVVLQSVTPQDGGAFFKDMRSRTKAGGKEAFVFIHGYNTSFDKAAKRAAQIAYDIDFEGLPILYSWPSKGSVLGYMSDSAVVDLSGRRLSAFLDDLVRKSGATRIHLIAHSMGNRALTDALELYALRHKGEKPAFDQVLFAAPDVDAGLFAAMAATIRPVANRMTLYASDRDWALDASRRLHGDAARAGQGGTGMLRLDTLDSIDMTALGDDMLKHNYYANSTSALTDILSLFWRDAGPDQRCGMVRDAAAKKSQVWRYAPDRCDGDALLPALSLLRKENVTSMAAALAMVSAHAASNRVSAAEVSRLDNAVSTLFSGR